MREGWPEVADFNDNIMKVGLAGETLAYRDFPLTLYRHGGKPEQVWLNLDYSPLLGEDGRPAGVMAIVVEITDKVRIERELEAERKSLKRMFEQAPGFIAMASGPEHRFTMVNEAYRTLVARSRRRRTRQSPRRFRKWSSRVSSRLLDRVYASGEPYFGRRELVNLQHGSGGALDERYLDFIYQPIVADNGVTTGIFIQGHDVTEQHETEQAIRAESRKLDVLNRTGAALAAELDVNKIVQIATDACTEIVDAQFGAFFYNVVNDEGRELHALRPLRRAEGAFRQVSHAAQHGRVRADLQGDWRRPLRRHPQRPPLREERAPLRHAERTFAGAELSRRAGDVAVGRGDWRPFLRARTDRESSPTSTRSLLIGIAGQAATAIDNARLYQAAEREVAERRRAEEALQVLNNTLEQRVLDEVYARSKVEEQLRQVQKMEAVGQLTGGIAHDFNNMLAVIMGGLSLLQRKLARGETDVERFVDAAIDGAQRAATLTQRLLAFSRQQPLSPEPLIINKLVAGMSELLDRTLGEQVKVETVLAAGLWQVKADPAQLENAILNLAVNARDAMPGGGRLTIETLNAFVDDAYAQEYAIEAGQYVLIAVADTGAGMTPEVIAKAFDPFFTTKGAGKGTGLGLSQVYGFVRQSGGHVKIYSELGVGTSVKIYLPRLYGEAAATEQAKRLATIHRGLRSEVVLVVEDDERVRALSVEALKELGYGVVEAAGPAQALRLLDEGREATLLFTDVVMPDMSGRELADRAREKRPD